MLNQTPPSEDSDFEVNSSTYDSSSESGHGNNMSQFAIQARQKKSFKPSTKKKIQLTFENLTVKTIPQRKKILFCEYGQPTKSKTVLDNISGTICPGQFVAMLGSSGKQRQL